MFSKLPDLFDRDFAIGYFLPIAIFITSSLLIASEFNQLSLSLNDDTQGQISTLIGTTVIGLLSWLGGIFTACIE